MSNINNFQDIYIYIYFYIYILITMFILKLDSLNIELEQIQETILNHNFIVFFKIIIIIE